MKILLSFAPNFIPLAKALHAHGQQLTTLHPNFTKMLTDMDVAADALVGYLDQSARTRALTYAAEVLCHLDLADKVLPIGLTAGARQFLRTELSAFLYQRLAEIASLVAATENLKPDLVIVHNDVDPVTRAAALWARSHQVPCLHIPHAIYMEVGRGAVGTDVHDLLTASDLAAAGPYQAAWYAARGLPEQHIHLTGLPQFDKYRHLNIDRPRARELLGLDLYRPVVTYASSWRQDTNLLGCHDGVEEYYLKFLEATKELPGAQVVIKTHPSSNNLEWHLQEAKQRGVHCLATALHLGTVLMASDALVAYGPSNILLEGSLFPHLRLVATHGYDEDDEIVKLGDEAPPAHIAATCKQLLSGPPPDYSALRFKYLGKTDGQATARVAALAETLCQPT